MKIIEETTLNSWPSLQQILYDGWILRFANGYTRRANSVNPIYAGSLNVAEKISRSEKVYQSKKLTPVFKITPFVQPANLDTMLDEAGYKKNAPTSVRMLDLTDVPQPSTTQTVQQFSTPTEEWIADYMRMNQVSANHVSTLRAILHNIAPETCFISLTSKDQTAACGLGVRDGNYVGLFDIVTDPDRRKQGFGTALILHILQWAKDCGAETAYLQVMLNNEPALRLYEKLGFREVYRYWYRMLG